MAPCYRNYSLRQNLSSGTLANQKLLIEYFLRWFSGGFGPGLDVTINCKWWVNVSCGHFMFHVVSRPA